MRAMPEFKENDAAAPVSGNAQRFLIHDPEKVWLVEKGSVDLFLVRAENGEPAGARRHVMRVEAGKAICGFAATEGDQQLLACLAPETRLVETSQARLREMASSADSAGAVELLEEWITSFAAASSGQVPPKVSAALEPGKETSTVKESKPVFPREGVVWVKHLEGESRYLASSQLPPVGAGVYFPVSASGWLEAQPKTKLVCFFTRQALAEDPAFEGLRAFHKLVLATLTAYVKEAEKKEAERFRRKADADGGSLDGALRRLGTPLRRKGEAGVPCEPEGDLLLAACQLTGDHLGVAIKAHPDSRGMATAVEDIARASGVRVRRVILAGQWWKHDNGPLVAFFEQGNRPVALIASSPGRYLLHDPGERRTLKVSRDLASKLGPYGYAFYRPFPGRKLNAVDLLAFGVRGCERDLFTILGMGVAIGIVSLAVPVATGVIFDSIVPGAQRPQLLQMSVFLLAMAICSTLFHLARSLAVLRLEGKMDASIQAAVWDRLLSLPVRFFRDYSSGDLATRGLGIDQMRQMLTGPALTSILSGIFSIFSFCLLFYYSWKLALLATALILVAFSAATFCGCLQVLRQREISRIRGRISGLVLQLIGGISKLRVSGAENRAFAVWAGNFAAQKGEAVGARRISNALAVFNASFPVLCALTIFYAMGRLLEDSTPGAMTTGDFLAFYVAFGQYLAAALLLSSTIVSVAGIVPLYERAKPILDALPEVDEAKSAPGDMSGEFEVKHLSFRYRPDTPLVLKDLSLSMPAGRFIAIVGSSGSGKSTLFRLLLGFEKPESGAIYYDGQDLTGLDIRAVRRQIGVVLQSGKLITANILQNIIGSAPLTIDEAWEAARMSGFDKDIKAMPMGMHTVISEGGGGLSGGQRQRLMIARAIVNKPRILLFDEATSALDNETQAVVSRSLEKLQATRVVIAHRLSTIAHADRIFVLDKGSVAESGAYGELIAGGGLFAELAKRQLV